VQAATQNPVAGSQTGVISGHTNRCPTQERLEHMSPLVQALPSLQVVPKVAGPGAQDPLPSHLLVGSQVVPEPAPAFPDPATVQAVAAEAGPGVQLPPPLQ